MAVGYLDTRYTRYIDEAGLNRAAEREFPDAPKLTASFGGQYAIPWNVEGQFSLLLSANYRSDVAIVDTPSILDQSAYTLWNAGVAWQSPKAAWELDFHASNLTNEHYVVDGYYYFTQFGFVTAFYGDPRTLTASLKYAF